MSFDIPASSLKSKHKRTMKHPLPKNLLKQATITIGEPSVESQLRAYGFTDSNLAGLSPRDQADQLRMIRSDTQSRYTFLA